MNKKIIDIHLRRAAGSRQQAGFYDAMNIKKCLIQIRSQQLQITKNIYFRIHNNCQISRYTHTSHLIPSQT
jgi:hypothetical protein